MRKYLKQFHLSAAAVLFGLILVLTQSAFKTKTESRLTTYYYYKIGGVSQWTTTAPSGLSCDNLANNQCSGTFATSPNGYPATNYSSIVPGILR